MIEVIEGHGRIKIKFSISYLETKVLIGASLKYFLDFI